MSFQGNSDNRFVTIAFDDGLLKGARKANELLSRFEAKASFFVVTGWIRPSSKMIRDPWNKGRDHGSWADWQEIEARGHEIGSHSRSHINATGKRARFVPSLLRLEIQGSYSDLRRNLRRSPVSIAMPFNACTPASERFVKESYQAALIGNQQSKYNRLDKLAWYRLAAWAPDSDIPVETICKTIEAIPENHWLIIQFHSLDDEGWMPIPSEKFEAILKFISSTENLNQVTVRNMVERCKAPQLSATVS